MYHGREATHVRYDYPFGKLEISPEMIILWARREILKLELPRLEEYIFDNEDSKDFDIDLYENMQTQGNAELTKVSLQFFEMKE